MRRYAIARSLFPPTTLGRAIRKLGFVQADPIRAPARAQDLILRQRVIHYRAGDLERRYTRLGIEEDFFVNYGFVPRATHELMHPRVARAGWSSARARQAAEVLEFVRARGVVHPREVEAHFAHGRETNWFGGASNVSTRLLEEMHYRGLLRVARREGGTRVYAVRSIGGAMEANDVDIESRLDILVDVVVGQYAPLTANGLGQLVSLLMRGVPQWRSFRRAAMKRARQRMAHERVDGVEWYWPDGESPRAARWVTDDRVRLLAPFDPIVWDRRRFENFWGWPYRFEAYTPAPRRKLGYYALPLLWREHVIGWANASVASGRLVNSFGYVGGRAPRGGAFKLELEAELERMRTFLGLDGGVASDAGGDASAASAPGQRPG